jgi:hypothetical protein
MLMFKCRVFLLLAVIFCFSATQVLAAHPEVKSEIENLKRRIKALEVGRKTSDVAGDEDKWFDHLEIHGLLEVEASFLTPGVGKSQSDFTMSTAELSFEAGVTDHVGGHLTLLYEEGEPFTVDGAVISIGCPNELSGSHFSLHAGQMYLPFGAFKSYMVSSPQTLELGETTNTALLLALESDLWSVKAAAFAGEVDKPNSSDTFDAWVAAIEFNLSEAVRFGGSYISDLAESGAELVQDAAFYDGEVDAASGFLSLHFGPVGVEAEYLTALDDFNSVLPTLGGDLTGVRPKALNFELAWMPTESIVLAGRYEQARDYKDDIECYGGAISYSLYDEAIVSLEYLNSKATALSVGSDHQVTAQLAVEF